jgi:hypothetical protein
MYVENVERNNDVEKEYIQPRHDVIQCIGETLECPWSTQTIVVCFIANNGECHNQSNDSNADGKPKEMERILPKQRE